MGREGHLAPGPPLGMAQLAKLVSLGPQCSGAPDEGTEIGLL